MLRTKKDVDRHVEQLESKIQAESERNLKAFTIAKLYVNVGEYETARKYLAKYISVRENSASAFKLNGQVCEHLGQREKAIASYKTALELDHSQRDIILKILDLYIRGGTTKLDKAKAKYWLEQGQIHFPRHQFTEQLRRLIAGESLDSNNGHHGGASEVVGGGDNNNPTAEEGGGSPTDSDHDSSVLWSGGASAANSFLNGSRRHILGGGGSGPGSGGQYYASSPRTFGGGNNLNASEQGTPSRGGSQRFEPRPSPERLGAQLRSVELTQERIVDIMSENNKAVMEEIKNHRLSLLEEMKINRQNTVDLKIEVKQGLHDLKMEVAKVCGAIRDASDAQIAAGSAHHNSQQQLLRQHVAVAAVPGAGGGEADRRAEAAIVNLNKDLGQILSSLPRQIANAMPVPPPPQVIHQAAAPPPTAQASGSASAEGGSLSLAEMQEALAQQTALLQMNSLGFAAGMFANQQHGAAAVGGSAPHQVPGAGAVRPPLHHPHHQNLIPPGVSSSSPIPPQPSVSQQLQPSVPKPASQQGQVWTPPLGGGQQQQHGFQVGNAGSSPHHPIVAAALAAAGKDAANNSAGGSSFNAQAAAIGAAAAAASSPLQQQNNFGMMPKSSGFGALSGDKVKQEPILSTPVRTSVSNSDSSTVGDLSSVSGSGNSSTLTTVSPHGYQINLPKNTTPITSSPFKEQEGPAVPITTTSILSTIPAPMFSSLKNTPPAIKPGSATGGFSFSTPTSIPSTINMGGSPAGNRNDDQDSSYHVEDEDHNPHFEPIIPLPELVEVKTGEEDEETIFVHRAKVYRYATDSKEWKERGVGDIKILKHPVRGTYRVLLRREQIHKIACNHLITTEMQLKPMAGSETAVCWFAMDYAEDEAKLEHLAVRFKTADTKNDFKEKFEMCQKELEKNPPKKDSSPVKISSTTSPTKPSDSKPTAVTAASSTAATSASEPPKPFAGFSFGGSGVSSVASPIKSEEKKEEPAAGKPLGFEAFKPKAGSWECKGCFMRNEGSQIQCPACQTAQPGKEEEVKKLEEAAKPKVAFGAQGGFSFTPAASTTGAASTGGFTFGSSAPAPAATGGFSFGSSTTMGGSGVSAITTPASEDAPDGHLSFDGQGLKLSTEADAKDLAAKIARCKGMKHLTLSGNTFGIEASKAIGASLEGHPEFEYAHWKDMFTGRMKTEIPPALKHLSKGIMTAGARLVELDLSDNAFGPIGMEGIVELLKSPSCYTLKELKLNNTGCGVTGGKKLAETLLEGYNNGLKAGTPLALKVFVLGRSRQENEGAKALAKVFKLMGSLEEVVMPQNGIYHEGIAALTDAFSCNPNLSILNMNDNTFTEKGAKSLADVLPKLQKLRILNLGDCLLKTEGALLIAKALESGHQSLEHLHLDSNEIKLDGGKAIVKAAITNKPNLKTLEIGTNQFGESGVTNLMDMLADAGKENLVGDEGIEDDEGSSDEEDEDGDDYDDDHEAEDEHEDEEEEEEGNKSASTGGPPKPAFGFSGPSGPVSSIFSSPNNGNSGIAKSSSVSSTTTADSPFKNASNIFGTPKSDAASTSIFGSGSTATSSSIFGGSSSTATANAPIFGGSSMPTASPSLFGGGAASTTGDDNKSGSIFGTPAKPPGASLFGTPNPAVSSSEGVDLSASKDLSSFASLASNKSTGFSFGQKSDSKSGEGFSFQGAGQAVFGAAKSSPSGKKDDGDDGAEAGGDDDHDPHFEPIIPLPELVDVKTGEEDEEVIFKYRAKVFRYDPDTKQWKERGVGDMKILKHPVRKTFRLLQRREQIHKISCNHLITTDMELKPMYGSENAVCWFAMDYAEDEYKLEHLAVRFKTADIKKDFQEKFEACQKELKDNPPPKTNEEAGVAAAEEDVEEEEEDDEEESIMFERECEILEKFKDGQDGQEDQIKRLGQVEIRIIYDDDVYGARIIANKQNEDDTVCNHLIAMQTSLSVDSESGACEWSALDFSLDPPTYRTFRAVFKSEEDSADFRDTFYEGKELADQSEILELPNQLGKPEDYYYGEGGDYGGEGSNS